ncbi:MAG: Three-deoxy-D-manno-octulosonic-acid transferase protein [Firmicutes bacterium]|nr:Three-deoxy-D-manno-octulosonic-acid transferase protein [Bacillota bacterium]
MKVIYNILAVVIVIMAIPVFIYRLIREDGFGERLKQSFGFLPEDTVKVVANKECIWLHAASVGEIVATSPIVKEIRKVMPDALILISVVTTNGYAMANRIIPEADAVIYFPLDLPWLGKSVIKRINPKIFLLVETELWPNFLQAAKTYNIPVLMVNGRISDKNVHRYRYLSSVLREMLSTVTRFCMQSTIDAEYIITLGADPHNVYVTGNTKFDQTYTEVSPAQKEDIASSLGFSKRGPILVAGSTHRGEETLIFSAFNQVKKSFPQAGLVIAPRDIMRAEEVHALAVKHNLKAKRRTKTTADDTDHDIIILDTIGELGKIYSIGEIIYVGGSLVPLGGHNILEPAAHGKPILVGPHMFNFKDSYALLSECGACDTVVDDIELGNSLLEILGNEEVRINMGDKALAVIVENRGAAQKSVQHLREILAVRLAAN